MPPSTHRGAACPGRPVARRGLLRIGLLAALALTVAAPVLAQVYSWRDPQTGQLRISTVPPPWLRDRGGAAGGPQVNVIKDGKVVPPERIGPGGKVLDPEPAAASGAPAAGPVVKAQSVPQLLERRSALLAQLVTDALRVGPTAANQAFFQRIDEYLAVGEELDAADPAGAAARNAERDQGMQRFKANIERVLRDPGQRSEFQGEATRWLSKKSDLTAQRIVRCLRDGLC